MGFSKTLDGFISTNAHTRSHTHKQANAITLRLKSNFKLVFLSDPPPVWSHFFFFLFLGEYDIYSETQFISLSSSGWYDILLSPPRRDSRAQSWDGSFPVLSPPLLVKITPTGLPELQKMWGSRESLRKTGDVGMCVHMHRCLCSREIYSLKISLHFLKTCPNPGLINFLLAGN